MIDRGGEPASTMTVREEMAKAAMQGFLSDSDAPVGDRNDPAGEIASLSVMMADSLLSALAKGAGDAKV